MIAAFAAAYMSTIATQLNWGASYLVNDFWRRFVKKNESDQYYVSASQVATVLLTLISAVVTFFMGSIGGAWKVLIVTGAGTGGVLLLRWYWWRINAWSEVSAMIAAFVVSVALQAGFGYDTDQPKQFALIMIATIANTPLRSLAARLGYCSGLSASLTRSATRRRTCRILVLARVGFTRLVSRIMKRSRSGSNQMDVPVKPVCPNASGPIFVPALERSEGVSHPNARLDPGGMFWRRVNS